MAQSELHLGKAVRNKGFLVQTRPFISQSTQKGREDFQMESQEGKIVTNYVSSRYSSYRNVGLLLSAKHLFAVNCDFISTQLNL